MYAFFKRLEDILISSAVLICASPLMFAVALALRLGGVRPIIFKQTRSGKGGKPFQIYKFRSMTDARDAEGRLLPDEERVTRIGRFIRKTSLDGLPQMINVLKGDMSIVGPRPLLPEYDSLYSPKHRRRLDVLPGITGYAAVMGRRQLFSKRFDLDVYYVDNASFLFDNMIILKTFWVVLTSKGSPEVLKEGEIDDLGFYKSLRK